jgi:two-component system NtrC family sensor kinase
LNELDLRGKHITVDINVDPKLPSVRGDANQLLQVFFNVINNAVDAMQEVGGGRLTIATRQDGSNAVAEFSDTGPGMAAPHLVFDPFYTTKPVGKGTGLGLSICYGILQEHGGRIRCYNRPEGGATFRVELPAVFVEVPARDAEPQHAVESR